MDLPNTRLWRDDPRPMASSPLIVVPTTTNRAAVLGSVKARPGNDGSCGQGRATADLDSPCARRPPTTVGRGEETGFQVEQRNWNEGRRKWRMREISA
jgi:hypothetical protein